jgi:hypothetical protein
MSLAVIFFPHSVFREHNTWFIAERMSTVSLESANLKGSPVKNTRYVQ